MTVVFKLLIALQFFGLSRAKYTTWHAIDDEQVICPSIPRPTYYPSAAFWPTEQMYEVKIDIDTASGMSVDKPHVVSFIRDSMKSAAVSIAYEVVDAEGTTIIPLNTVNLDGTSQSIVVPSSCTCTSDNGQINLDPRQFPADYGRTCGYWDSNVAQCLSWYGSKMDQCCGRWCYADPTCPDAMMSEVNYGAYYSYQAACGSVSAPNCTENVVTTTDPCACIDLNTQYGNWTQEDIDKFGADYGSSCKTWDMENCANGNYPESQLDTWCCENWCYVQEACPDAIASFFKSNLWWAKASSNRLKNQQNTRCVNNATQVAQCPFKAKPVQAVANNTFCTCMGYSPPQLHVTGGRRRTVSYPSDYGANCSNHDASNCAAHFNGAATGVYCCQTWCYVDEECPTANPSILASGWFWSYTACPDNGPDLRTCTYSNVCKPTNMNPGVNESRNFTPALPDTYGKGCAAHDEDNCAAWWNTTWDFWDNSSNASNSWCCQSWAYIEEACPVGLEGMAGLTYSYEVCSDLPSVAANERVWNGNACVVPSGGRRLEEQAEDEQQQIDGQAPLDNAPEDDEEDERLGENVAGEMEEEDDDEEEEETSAQSSERSHDDEDELDELDDEEEEEEEEEGTDRSAKNAEEDGHDGDDEEDEETQEEGEEAHEEGKEANQKQEDGHDGDDEEDEEPHGEGEEANHEQECIDIDNGEKDIVGDDCDFYNAKSSLCGYYDTDDFRAGKMCCACGGGTLDEAEDDSEEDDVDHNEGGFLRRLSSRRRSGGRSPRRRSGGGYSNSRRRAPVARRRGAPAPPPTSTPRRRTVYAGTARRREPTRVSAQGRRRAPPGGNSVTYTSARRRAPAAPRRRAATSSTPRRRSASATPRRRAPVAVGTTGAGRRRAPSPTVSTPRRRRSPAPTVSTPRRRAAQATTYTGRRRTNPAAARRRAPTDTRRRAVSVGGRTYETGRRRGAVDSVSPRRRRTDPVAATDRRRDAGVSAYQHRRRRTPGTDDRRRRSPPPGLAPPPPPPPYVQPTSQAHRRRRTSVEHRRRRSPTSYGYTSNSQLTENYGGHHPVKSEYGFTGQSHSQSQVANVMMAGAAVAAVGTLAFGGYYAYTRYSEGKMSASDDGVDTEWCRVPDTHNGQTLPQKGKSILCTDCYKVYGTCGNEDRCYTGGGCNYVLPTNTYRDDLMGTGFVPSTYTSPITIKILSIVGTDFTQTIVCPKNNSNYSTTEEFVTASVLQPELYVTLAEQGVLEIETSCDTDTHSPCVDDGNCLSNAECISGYCQCKTGYCYNGLGDPSTFKCEKTKATSDATQLLSNSWILFLLLFASMRALRRGI